MHINFHLRYILLQLCEETSLSLPPPAAIDISNSVRGRFAIQLERSIKASSNHLSSSL